MAHLGHDPELEEKLYCEDCRGGAHGQVLAYDHDEVLRLLNETKELKLGDQCVRCGEKRKHKQAPHAEPPPRRQKAADA